MELYLLQSFVAVARAGSLSQAATVRNISLSGISKHVRLLEEEFGFALFRRCPRGMALSAKGADALQIAEEILQKVECLNALAKPSAQMRIGVNISPDFLRLSQLTELLQVRYPSQKIILATANSGTLLQQLAIKELDLCLAFGEVSAHFKRAAVGHVRLPLMVPAAMYHKNLDLHHSRWIIGSSGCPFQKRVEEFWREQRITPHTRIIAKDSSQKELVSQGLGLGFLEPQDGLALVDSGLAVQYDGHYLNISLAVVYTQALFTQAAELLCKYVAARYEALDNQEILVREPPA